MNQDQPNAIPPAAIKALEILNTKPLSKKQTKRSKKYWDRFDRKHRGIAPEQQAARTAEIESFVKQVLGR